MTEINFKLEQLLFELDNLVSDVHSQVIRLIQNPAKREEFCSKIGQIVMEINAEALRKDPPVG